MKQMIVILTIFILGTQAYGAFDSIGGTAPSKAFGEAIFGTMDGVNSVGYNPATISLLRDIQIYAAWDTPYAGFNDGSGLNAINVDVVVPFWNAISAEPYVTRRAAFGLSVHRNSLTLTDGVNSSEIYHEGIYSFSYAKDLNDVISRGAKISVGIRFNIFDVGYSAHSDLAANPLLAGDVGNKLGFGLDLGLTYDFSESIRLGLSMKNLISPNLSIVDGGTNKLVSEMRFGANWDIGRLLFMKGAKMGVGIVSYGRDANDNRTADMSYNLGYQFGVVSAQDLKTKPFKGELFTFRLGAIYQSKKLMDDVINLTGGLGFMYIIAKKHKFNIDYALEYGLNSGIMQHTAGMTYSILLPRSAFIYDKKEYSKIVKEELKEANKGEEDLIYEDQFPTNFAHYDEVLLKVDELKKSSRKLSVDVTNFGVAISRLLDPAAPPVTNTEQALKEFKQALRSKGARIRVKVIVASTVSYKVLVRANGKLPEDVQTAIDEFDKLMQAVPVTISDIRNIAATTTSLSNQIKTLQQSAPQDFVKKNRRYLKKVNESLATADLELQTIPEEVTKMLPQYKALLKIITKVYKK